MAVEEEKGKVEGKGAHLEGGGGMEEKEEVEEEEEEGEGWGQEGLREGGVEDEGEDEDEGGRGLVRGRGIRN